MIVMWMIATVLILMYASFLAGYTSGRRDMKLMIERRDQRS